MTKSRNVTRIFLLLGLSILLSACGAADAATLPYVDLSHREPLPAIAQADVVPLRIAVAAIISPQGTAESYTELANYLGDKLARPVELVQRRTYAEVNNLVAKHEVDVAFVCTSAYIDGHNRFGMDLLVAPEIDGELVYYSELIVPIDSPAQSILDLRGKVFAFTDPMSFSGRVYPTYLLQQQGENPETFFARTFFTYSHDRAIEAVAAGVADGAAVDSLVLEYAMKRDPRLRERLRVIYRSPPFGIPPVVTPPDLSPRQKAQLQEVLLTMHKDPRGQAVLKDLGIDRFVEIDARAYEGVSQIIQRTGALP